MLKTDFTVKSIVGTQDLEWEEPLPNSPEATRILGAAEEHMSVTIYFCFFCKDSLWGKSVWWKFKIMF